MIFPSGATCSQTMEVAWEVETGQDRLGSFCPQYHPKDRAGQGGILTIAPPGLAPFPPPQSTRQPPLWLPPSFVPGLLPQPLWLGPGPELEPQTQQPAQARPRARRTGRAVGVVMEGQGRKGDRNGGICGYRKGLSLATWTVTTRACASCPRHACVHTHRGIYRCSPNT